MASTVRSILNESSWTSFAEVAERVIGVIEHQETGSVSDQRTLRRRVYDVLNVFSAMGLIVKDSKSIRYRIAEPQKSVDAREQARARLLLKEKILADKARLLLGHLLLIERNRGRVRLGNAIQLPVLFVAFGDVGDGQVQCALDGRWLEISAGSPPRFFSPMNLFDAFRFSVEDQTRMLRQFPEFGNLEPLVRGEELPRTSPKEEEWRPECIAFPRIQ
jgi:hypothetical protein